MNLLTSVAFRSLVVRGYLVDLLGHQDPSMTKVLGWVSDPLALRSLRILFESNDAFNQAP